MGVTLIIGLGMVSMLLALALTLWGILALTQSRRFRLVQTNKAPEPLTVHLENQGIFPTEPGVLLNTLWEHLPNAACQSGECGGCKVRLLDGDVAWIREPVAEIDKSTHILACSCEARGPIRCALA